MLTAFLSAPPTAAIIESYGTGTANISTQGRRPIENTTASADSRSTVSVVQLDGIQTDYSLVGRRFIVVSQLIITLAVILIVAEVVLARVFVSGWVVLAVIVGAAGWWRTAVVVRKDLAKANA